MSSIVIRELLTAYGFKTDTKDLDAADSKLAVLKKTAMGMATVAMGAGAALAGVVKSFADTANSALDASKILNISIEDYQELAHAAANAGSDVKGVTGAMDAMLRRMPRASKEGSDLNKIFKSLGVEIKDSDGTFRNRVDIFEDMIGALNGVEDLTKRQVLQQQIFGTRAGEVNTIIIDGVEAFRRSREELRLYGVAIGEDAANQAKAFNDAMGNVGTILKGIRNIIGSEFIPVFQRLVESFTDWFLANEEMIKTNIGDWARAAAAGLETIVDVVVSVVSGVKTTVEALGGLRRILSALMIMGAVFTLMHVINHIRWTILLLQHMGSAALLGKLKLFFASMITGFKGIGNSAFVANLKVLALPLGIAIAIVALGLLLDELWAFFNGHDSMIGELAKQWPWLANAMGAFKNAGEEIGDFFYHLSVLFPIWWDEAAEQLKWQWEELVEAFSDFGGLMGRAWDDFVTIVKDLWQEVVDFFTNVLGLLKIEWTSFTGWMGQLWDGMISGITARIQALIARLVAMKDQVKETISSIPGAGLITSVVKTTAGAYGSAYDAGKSFVNRRLSGSEGAPAEGGVSIGGDTIDINITQRPGEDADAFQARLMAEMRRDRESQRRQTLDALQSGRRR